MAPPLDAATLRDVAEWNGKPDLVESEMLSLASSNSGAPEEEKERALTYFAPTYWSSSHKDPSRGATWTGMVCPPPNRRQRRSLFWYLKKLGGRW